jgi:hypothetical protein
MQSLNPELKTYYSQKLLDRLVPALIHVDHGLAKDLPEVELDEIGLAVAKWDRFFDGEIPTFGEMWDDGYYHSIISSCVT